MSTAVKSPTCFTISEVLGSGQNGIVLAARCNMRLHPNPCRVYALKVCFNFDQDTLGASGAFINEFVELAKLPRHQNVVAFYTNFFDVITDDIRVYLPDFAQTQSRIVTRGGAARNRKTQYFVLEHLDRCLASHLTKVHPPPVYVPERVTVFILLQLADALLHLAKHSIAHRDVKL